MGRQIGEVKKGYGVQVFTADPEKRFAVVKDPAAESDEERLRFGASTLLAGADVRPLLIGERKLDEVLIPAAEDPNTLELTEGNMLLFERPDEEGVFDIVYGPTQVQELVLPLAS